MGSDGESRRERLRRARLYVVSGARRERGDLDTFLDAVLAGGADIVQLREKQAEAGDLVRWGTRFREAASRHHALFVVNDRPDVALALDADGVHLGQGDLPATVARRILGAEALIGLSTHTVRQLSIAPAEADYLCAGPVYATPTKPGRPATGLGLLRQAAARTAAGDERRPWFAIGGIDASTLPDVLAAGGRRVVVVRAVDTVEPAAAAAALRRLLDAEIGRPAMRR